MTYAYTQKENIYGLIIDCKINAEDEANLVCFNFDINEPDHATLIGEFSDVNKLEKYVVYLCANPDRQFNLTEILITINN